MSASSFRKQRPVHEPGNRIERRRDEIHVQSRPFFIENGTSKFTVCMSQSLS